MEDISVIEKRIRAQVKSQMTSNIEAHMKLFDNMHVFQIKALTVEGTNRNPSVGEVVALLTEMYLEQYLPQAQVKAINDFVNRIDEMQEELQALKGIGS